MADRRAGSLTTPHSWGTVLETQLEEWAATRGTERLWAKDASLWTGGDEDRWLGWLDPRIGSTLETRLADLRERYARNIDRVILLGMGGSSLGALLLDRIGGVATRERQLLVLDTLAPGVVATALRKAEEGRTLVISSSKSGTTLETRALTELFLGKVPVDRFVAITDPGSALERLAVERGFAAIFRGDPAVGGRFSVLSPFGLVPAALVGVDLGRLIGGARQMARLCRDPDADTNPGVRLGALLALAAQRGRDKLTLLGIGHAAYGAWLEQLIAESTGKNGKGILPVTDEPVGRPTDYGDDRFFVEMVDPDRLTDDVTAGLLEAAGHPVARVPAATAASLGAEVFRWMFGTAVAAAMLGIHPFDQPDVEASKQRTRQLVAEMNDGGCAGGEDQKGKEEVAATATDSSFSLSSEGQTGDSKSLLRRLLDSPQRGDYLALLAYTEPDDRVATLLEGLRAQIRDRTGLATSLGFGPRYLHSTGQFFKGGPSGGRFLVLTATSGSSPRLSEGYDLGQLLAAQARGDCEVLSERGRKVVRVHLGPDWPDGLSRLRTLLSEVL